MRKNEMHKKQGQEHRSAGFWYDEAKYLTRSAAPAWPDAPATASMNMNGRWL